MKNDFKRLLSEQERAIEQMCINNIFKFDLFKTITKLKLKNTFQLFYDPNSNCSYKKNRN